MDNYFDFFLKDLNVKMQDQLNDYRQVKEDMMKNNIEKLGIKIDFNEEKERRFSRFVCECDNGKETYWFNDGSVTGIKIAEFTRRNVENSNYEEFIKIGRIPRGHI